MIDILINIYIYIYINGFNNIYYTSLQNKLLQV